MMYVDKGHKLSERKINGSTQIEGGWLSQNPTVCLPTE